MEPFPSFTHGNPWKSFPHQRLAPYPNKTKVKAPRVPHAPAAPSPSPASAMRAPRERAKGIERRKKKLGTTNLLAFPGQLSLKWTLWRHAEQNFLLVESWECPAASIRHQGWSLRISRAFGHELLQKTATRSGKCLAASSFPSKKRTDTHPSGKTTGWIPDFKENQVSWMQKHPIGTNRKCLS